MADLTRRLERIEQRLAMPDQASDPGRISQCRQALLTDRETVERQTARYLRRFDCEGRASLEEDQQDYEEFITGRMVALGFGDIVGRL